MRTNSSSTSSVLRPALLAAAILVPGANAQEQDDPQPERPSIKELNPMREANPQEELEQLFKKVELRLRQIDRLLVEASSGDTSKLDEVGESGIDELLREAPQSPSAAGGLSGALQHSKSQGQEVVKEIDRIIEIAQAAGGSCSQPGGESPLDNRGEQKTERSTSPEGPKEKKEPGKSDQPEGNQDRTSKPDKKPASQAPKEETEPPTAVVDDSQKWGELPTHARDIFRAEGGKRLPTRYRDWIDSYYRRLNERSGD